MNWYRFGRPTQFLLESGFGMSTALIAAVTVSVAIVTQRDFWPEQQRRHPLLAFSSFALWFRLLYSLRAFNYTGRLLLPIMKSIYQIKGMILILFFFVTAFMHAYWAMDRTDEADVLLYSAFSYLYTGEQFIEGDDLREMSWYWRAATIVLSFTAIFFFIAWALNVFIAVLSDCYDLEQEMVISTFMKERAKICSALFLRPRWPARANILSNAGGWKWLVLLLVIAGIIYHLLLFYCLQQGWTAWPAALFLTACSAGVQAMILDASTFGWEERYLWVCYEDKMERDLKEETEEQDFDQRQGRISRMKRYMHGQIQLVKRSIKNTSHADVEVDDLRRSIELLERRSKTQEETLVRQEELLQTQRVAQERLQASCEGLDSKLEQITELLRRAHHRRTNARQKQPEGDIKEAITHVTFPERPQQQ